MKKRLLKSILALTLATTTMVGLTGCGSTSFVSNDVSSYPLVNALTEQELIDYYAKSLEYDTIVTRHVEIDETTYSTKDIDGAKAERLKALVSEAEKILGKNEYEYSVANANVVSEDNYNYIKALIDNYYLTNSQIETIKGALGYYFIDVTYDINPRELGTFNQMTPLIGLDGVFQSTATGSYTIDAGYMITVAKKLNEYYATNRIMKAATFELSTGLFQIIDGADPNIIEAYTNNGASVSTNEVPVVDNETTEGTETEGTETETEAEELFDAEGNLVDAEGNILMSAEEYLSNQTGLDTDTLQELENAGIDMNGGMEYDSIVSKDREITLDTDLINSIAGISLKQKAFLPDLNLVYNKPAEQGVISGYGIYSAGGNGLKVFDFNRNNIEGTIKLRYVFKDASDGTDTIIGTNIYVVEEEVTTGFNISQQNLVIPDFLNTQLEIMVDRSDRVIANCDLSGLMSGNVYQDMGFAVLRGYKEINTNLLKHLSTIRQVIARDSETNSYLLEIETTSQEGSKSSDVYGTYRDKYYIVVQQQGTDFVIVDSLRMSRDMVKEPAINPDDATTKRLVALNLAGDVTEDARANVNSLLSDWYTACTNRVLNIYDSNGNKKEIKIDGQVVDINRGMYDCFQNDVSMLATKDLEYMQSEMRGKLDKYGSGLGVVVRGTVTEWIGGAENQVEFTTEELITYNGRNEGYYMQVYYLVSNMNDVWVIDERTIIDERDVTGTDLSNILDRVQ